MFLLCASQGLHPLRAAFDEALTRLSRFPNLKAAPDGALVAQRIPKCIVARFLGLPVIQFQQAEC